MKMAWRINPILPPNPPGGLSNPLIFNKSPLGDLGVDIEKEAFGQPQ